MKDRILCLDMGDAWIGVAVSDALGLTAQAVKTIQVKKHYIEEIKGLVEQYSAKKIVVGYPLETSGAIGKKAKSVRGKADTIRIQLSCEVELWDERFSTKEAQRIMQYNNVNEKDQKKVIDMLSAQVILQNYLETLSIRDTYQKNTLAKGEIIRMDDNKIVLISESNEEIEFMVDDEFEFEGAKYLVLCEDEESEDALLFRLDEGEDGEMLLVEVSDDAEFEKVSKYYFEN
ncbi:MAG: Holliday junction resolvase RuvX [Eubacteriaceae bacterium]|nr:Holliday junction resolvase RuvX [Eubacteriaceae bacterium]